MVILGVASLSAFTQVNYAGIPLTKLPESSDSLASTVLYSLLDNNSALNSSQQYSERTFQLTALKLSGEDVYSCIHFPMLLLLARAVLAAAAPNKHTTDVTDVVGGVLSRVGYTAVDSADATAQHYQIRSPSASPMAAPVVQVWALRALSVHQDALIDHTVSVRVELHQLMNQLGRAYGIPAMLNTANRLVDTSVSADARDTLPEFMEDSTPLSIGASPFDPANQSVENTEAVLDPAYSHTLAAALAAAPAHDGSGLSHVERFSRSIRACVCLEVARLCRVYWQNQCAQRLLFAASVLAGFRTVLTGVMGKRTRYQVRSHAQLIVVSTTETEMLRAHAHTPAEDAAVVKAMEPAATALYDCIVPAGAEPAPGHLAIAEPAVTLDVTKMDLMPDIPLDTMDDVYLATPALDTDPAEAIEQADARMRGHHLSWLGHLACLSHAEHIRTNNPSGDLTNSEELAYVNASLMQQYRIQRGDGVAVHGGEGEVVQKNVIDRFDSVNDLYLSLAPWAAHALALHIRSRLELGDHRRQVRSLAQLETIGSVFRNEQLVTLQPHDSDCGLHRVQASADTVRADTAAEADVLMSQLALGNSITASLTMHERRLRLTRWRMSALFTAGCPSWWHHKRAYAEIAIQAKLRQTALDAFVEIGMWEQVIESLVELGRKAQAEALVRSRLPAQGWLAAVDGEKLADDVPLIEEVDEEAPAPEDAPKTLTAAVVLAENHIQNRFQETGALSSQSSRKKGMDLPEHKLWSLLGDIKDNPEYYHKAWDVSNGTFPRAKRALGRHYFILKEWHRAYRHFMDSLAINSANPEVWFASGVCALELRRFGDAIEAFSRTASINPDHAEAWNNLAACHLHCENTRSAFGALEHAIHLKRDSWKMWENYLNCALDLQEYQKAANALGRLCSLRGTTDAGTLLPVQYSGTQAQLHMFAAAVLTDAATADAMKAFRANMQSKRVASSAPVAAYGSHNSDSNVPADHSVIEQSFLSFQVLSVLTQMESIAGSMVAQENSLGGRNRGGGIEAGMGNSITAELDLRARVAADRARKAAERQEAEEDKDYDEDEADDVVGELGDVAPRERKPRAFESRMVAANNEIVYSLAQRYQVFIADCLARLHAGVQQYVSSAQARERQATLIMRDGTDWSKDETVLAELEDVALECIRMYRLAADIDKAVSKETGESAANMNGTSEMNAAGCYTAARFFANRMASGLQLALRSVGGDVIPPMVKRMEQTAAELMAQATAASPAEAVVAVEEAPRDEYSAYSDNYDSYW
jgi:tetratricopeptide (TPR) repeat protein